MKFISNRLFGPLKSRVTISSANIVNLYLKRSNSQVVTSEISHTTKTNEENTSTTASTKATYVYEANYSRIGMHLKLYGTNLNQSAVEGAKIHIYIFNN